MQHWFGEDQLSLSEVPPSECATQLKAGLCDMALMPVGALSDFDGTSIMKDHSSEQMEK